MCSLLVRYSYIYILEEVHGYLCNLFASVHGELLDVLN